MIVTDVTKEELVRLRNQIVSNLERGWEITGWSEDELTGVMVQISQVVAKQLSVQGEKCAYPNMGTKSTRPPHGESEHRQPRK